MIIVGVDLAMKYTGLTVIESMAVWPDYRVLHEEQVVCEVNDTMHRIKAALYMKQAILDAGAELVVIEDYTKQSMSFVSFSVGELGGMLRYVLWENAVKQLWVAPMKMKMFLGDGKTPIKKKEVNRLAEELFGFKSTLHYAKQRSDATDAFVLAMVGDAYHRLIAGEVLNLSRKQYRVFFGKTGLIRREG